MASSIHTVVGSTPIEKRRRYKKRPISYALVTLTFKKEGEPDHVRTLSHRDYSISRRSQVTRQWLQDKVDEMLEGRSDLDGLELRSVDVEAIETIWSTPYDHLFPSEDSK